MNPAHDLPRQEGLILEILKILEILLQTIKIAGETRSDARMASEGPRATNYGHLRHRDQEVSPTGDIAGIKTGTAHQERRLR